MLAAAAPKYNSASGGTESTVSNYNGTGETWKVHTFESSGTLTVNKSISTFRVLVVAGGGSGGNGFFNGAPNGLGGGGGAGGLLEDASRTISIGSKTVTVGTNSNNSVFDGLTADAGGNGGSSFVSLSTSGGSGGGGDPDSSQGYNNNGAAGVLGQGHNGANSSPGFGGDGGGAGANGNDVNHTQSGRTVDITGSNVTYSIGGLRGSQSTPTGYGHGGGGGAPTGAQSGRQGVVIVAYRIG